MRTGMISRRLAWAPALAGLMLAGSGCTQPSASKSASAKPAAESAAVENGKLATSASPAEQDHDAAVADEVVDVMPTADPAPAGSAPSAHEVAKPVIGEYAANVPPVLLSSGHGKLCKVNVGDSFPAINLPKVGGGDTAFDSLLGPKATVVLFWTDDRWMSETALRDLALVNGDGIALVGVAVDVNDDAAKNMIAETAVKFPQLLDESGAASAEMGEGALPRIFVLDGQHHVAWFDIEYSEATRRELQQTLAALTK